ncbi:MAG: H-NS histone family protein [Pseudomonadota bacterium]
MPPKRPDLAKFSIAELKAIIKDAEKAIETMAVVERKRAREAAEAAAKEFGFSLSDLVGGQKAGKAAGGKSPAKFRNPEDSTQTWSGRGRQPAWYRAAISAGKSPEDLAI